MTVVPASAAVVSELLVPTSTGPVVVLSKVVERVRNVTPVTVVSQPTATIVPAAAIVTPVASSVEAAMSLVETVVTNVSLSLQSPVVLVQLESTTTSNPVTASQEMVPSAASGAEPCQVCRSWRLLESGSSGDKQGDGDAGDIERQNVDECHGRNVSPDDFPW